MTYQFLNVIRYLTKSFIYSLEMRSINHASPFGVGFISLTCLD